MTDLKDAKIDNKIKARVLCLEMNQGTMKSGDSFVTVTFRDKTGEATAPYWNTSISDMPFKVGDVLDVFAFVGEYNGKLQLKVVETQPQPNENPMDYLPGISENERLEIIAEIKLIAGTVKHPLFRSLLDHFFKSPEWKKFIYAPAAKGMHNARIGGLLAHTAHVLRIANKLHPKNDLLITGAILHDVGKLATYNIAPGFSYTMPGALLEHIVIGILYLQELADGILDDYSHPDWVKLLHLIASHHGNLEWGSPVKPQIPEAMILHQADLTATRIEQMQESYAENSGTGSVKAFKISGSIWKD